MTDKEIFEKYCEIIDFPIEYIKTLEDEKIIKDSLGYKRYELQIAIQELKQSIKDAIAEIRLMIKGSLK